MYHHWVDRKLQWQWHLLQKYHAHPLVPLNWLRCIRINNNWIQSRTQWWRMGPGLAPKAWLKAPEAWLNALEAWLKAPKDWLKAPKAWLKAPESWLEAPESWLEAPESWLEAPEAWLGGRMYVHMDRKKSPFSIGHCPQRVCCPKRILEKHLFSISSKLFSHNLLMEGKKCLRGDFFETPRGEKTGVSSRKT